MLKVIFAKENENDKDLTPQHKVILQQKQQALNMVDNANESLDGKALKIFQASSIIIAIAGLLVSPQFAGLTISSAPIVLIGVIFMAFVLMIWFSIIAVQPKRHHIPGTQNWEKLFTQYICEDIESTFNQVLSDYIKTIDILLEANNTKAKLVRASAFLLMLQVSVLLGLLFLSIL
jgi:uncharacterized membrane protein YagU involved in acid resistance